MAETCNVCGLGVKIVLEMRSPTISQVRIMTEAIEVNGSLLRCSESERICWPLMKLAREKQRAEKEIAFNR